MTTSEDVTRAVHRMADTLPLLGPWRGKDDLFGFWPDARMRTAETVASAWCAGEGPGDIYREHGVPAEASPLVVVAWLWLELTLRRARIPERDWGAVVTAQWPREENP